MKPMGHEAMQTPPGILSVQAKIGTVALAGGGGREARRQAGRWLAVGGTGGCVTRGAGGWRRAGCKLSRKRRVLVLSCRGGKSRVVLLIQALLALAPLDPGAGQCLPARSDAPP